MTPSPSYVEKFISKIENMEKNNSPNIAKIKNKPMFYSALRDLDKLVGLEIFKINITDMIITYLMDSDNSTRNHTVLSGDPGCGKTSIAKILARIFVSLNIVNIEEKKDESSKKLFNPDVDGYEEKLIYFIIFGSILLEYAIVFLGKISLKMKIILLIVVAVIALVVILYLNLPSFNFKDDKEEKESSPLSSEDYFVSLTRDQLVAQYLGQSAIKTRKALQKCIKKVVFIDEAYSLVNGRDGYDMYGKEVLDVLINHMDTYGNSTIFIFAGYEDSLEKSIFAAQPGLKRRITWNFSIDKYSTKELFTIFKKQLKDSGMVLEKNENIYKLFESKIHIFPYSGGDTERLVIYIKNIYSRHLFDNCSVCPDGNEEKDNNMFISAVCKKVEKGNKITYQMVKEGLDILERAQKGKKEEKDKEEEILEKFNKLKNIF